MKNKYSLQVIHKKASNASPTPSDPQVDSWTALQGAHYLLRVQEYELAREKEKVEKEVTKEARKCQQQEK